MASLTDYMRMLAERDLAAVWPQWHIVRLLGTGSFGEVYEIERTEYGRTSHCALKILRRENTTPSGDIYNNISRANASEDFISTVLKEIDIMEKLKGAPNIVVIDDYEVTRNTDSCAVLIRMELLKNIGEFMSSRRIMISDIIRIGVDICNALEYCEEQCIIHRDVKESNIFYSDMGMFKLGDFGISRQLNSYLMNNATMTSAGTVSKMAPEVYNGEKYDNRVDIYSLGMVLYALLNNGRPPFYPPYPEEFSAEAAHIADMKRIKGTAIPPLEGIDQRLSKIICKACSHNPDGRYKNARQFREALLEYYSSLFRTETAEQTRQKEQPRKKSVLLAGGIILITSIIAIVGSILIWFGSDINKRDSGSNENNNLSEEETRYSEQEKSVEEVSEERESDSGGASEQSAQMVEDMLKSRESSSEETTEEADEQTLNLKNEEGETIAIVTKPTWAAKRMVEGPDDITYLSASEDRMLNVFFMQSISSSSYILMAKDLIQMQAEDWGFDEIEIIDESEAEVNGNHIDWLTIRFKIDAAYGIYYWGSVSCEQGCVSVVSTYSGAEEYPDINEKEYLQDAEYIEIVQ